MFGSDHAGERAAAALKADQHIRRLGLTWADVIQAPPEWQHLAMVVRGHEHMLSDKERDFIANIARLRKPPTDAQLQWLVALHDRVTREVAA
jgi:hypothetical protein